MTKNMYLVKGDWFGSAANTELTAYKIDNLNNLNWSVDTPVTPMPLPEDSHKENILVKMEGNTAKMDLSWTLTDGTQFGTVDTTSRVFTDGDSQTVYEHLDKFKEQFVPISIGDKFVFLITDENNTQLLLEEGTISNMSFSVSGGSPIVWNVNCAFYVGNVVAMLEADIPPAPTIVVASSPSANQLKIQITAYDGYGTEPSGDSIVTGLAYKYKLMPTGTWSDVVTKTNNEAEQNSDNDPLTYVITIPNSSGKEYRIKAAQINGYTEDANQYYWKYGKISGTDTVDIPIT